MTKDNYDVPGICPAVPEEDMAGNCRASDCMEWRWDWKYESAIEEGMGGDLIVRLVRLRGEPIKGYCGIGGKPIDV